MYSTLQGCAALQPVPSLRFYIWELGERNSFYLNIGQYKKPPRTAESDTPWLSEALEGENTETEGRDGWKADNACKSYSWSTLPLSCCLHM